MVEYYDWNAVQINWADLDMTWDQVGLLVNEVLPFVGFPAYAGGARKIDINKINELPKEKKRTVIMIACQVEGDEYIEYKYKNDEDLVITVDHINIIVDKILNNIKVNVQNIS